MPKITSEQNKAIVLEAFDTLFNKRDYAAAERYWSPDYIQHSAHIEPGREGLFNLIKSIPPTLKYEAGPIVADDDFVMVHGRFSGFGAPVNWIAADILRMKEGILVEHWDVIQDEATEEQSKSGKPMFGNKFPQSFTVTSDQKEKTMSEYTAITVPTQFVEANGIRFAYRRWGKKGNLPLVFNQHFNGNMDNWDPAVLDGLAEEREVIIFNNAGVASSSGDVPLTFEGIARNAEFFIDALGLKQVDLLGFSIGGFVAQQIVLDRPDLVRKLVLVGTAPRNQDVGEGQNGLTPETVRIFGATYDPPENLWLKVFFTDSDKSQAAGREFLKRYLSRTENPDLPVSDKVAPAQMAAVAAWKTHPGEPYAYLKDIKQPTLVVSGNHELICYAINSLHLVQNIPDAKLILYPDANHGSWYQYHDDFVFETNRFLNA